MIANFFWRIKIKIITSVPGPFFLQEKMGAEFRGFSDSSGREYSGWPGCKRDEGGALNGVLATLTSLALVVHIIVVIVNKVKRRLTRLCNIQRPV
jgi:hypothetical protein